MNKLRQYDGDDVAREIEALRARLARLQGAGDNGPDERVLRAIGNELRALRESLEQLSQDRRRVLAERERLIDDAAPPG